MGCGCGGSARTAEAQQKRRQAAQTARDVRRPRQPVGFGDPGFTWTGPAGRPKQPTAKP